MQLTLEQISHRVGAQTWLYPMDLALAPGAVSVLLGATQAGKTTLMRLMAGLDRPTQGQVRVDGHTLLHAARQLPRTLVHGLRQANGGQQAARVLALRAADAAFGHEGRKRHVFQCRERGQQVVELEDKPQRAATAQRQRGILKTLYRFTVEPVAAGRHGLEQAQNIEQRALARS